MHPPFLKLIINLIIIFHQHVQVFFGYGPPIPNHADGHFSFDLIAVLFSTYDGLGQQRKRHHPRGTKRGRPRGSRRGGGTGSTGRIESAGLLSSTGKYMTLFLFDQIAKPHSKAIVLGGNSVEKIFSFFIHR